MYVRLSRMPARRSLPCVQVRLQRRNWRNWRDGRWNGRHGRSVQRRKRRKPGHLYLQLSSMPARSCVRGVQLRVQRRCNDDHDRSDGDHERDHRNRNHLKLWLGNGGGGVRVPGVRSRNVVSPLQWRHTPSAAVRSMRRLHRRRELRGGHCRRVRLGGAGHRLCLRSLSVGDVRSDEGSLGRRLER